jgi:hypothetical protein
MAERKDLTNRDLAELLALESESAGMPAKKALRAASRRALMWPEEAADIHRQGRSLTELAKVGPYIERVIARWLDEPPEIPEPPEIRRNFLIITEAQAALRKKLSWLPSVRGDLQMHTTWSDGDASILETAEAAVARGYQRLEDRRRNQ